jgi:hypothetical protein
LFKYQKAYSINRSTPEMRIHHHILGLAMAAPTVLATIALGSMRTTTGVNKFNSTLSEKQNIGRYIHIHIYKTRTLLKEFTKQSRLDRRHKPLPIQRQLRGNLCG